EGLDRRYGMYGGPIRHLDLTGDAATDATLIGAVTRPDAGDSTLREGEHLQGVVLAVRGDAGALVAVKNTRGILPPSGHAWVRQIDPSLPAEARRQLLRRGDVIQVRVAKVDPAGKAHTLALEQEPLVQGALVAIDVGSGHVLAMVGGYDFMK